MNNLMTTLSGIAITIAFYAVFYQIYKRKPLVLLHPNIISTIIIALLLYITDIPFSTYNQGGHYITSILGICIVVLAIPMYETLETLTENLAIILTSSLFSIYTSFTTIFLLSRLFGFPKRILISLIPKSITTAMAIEASKIIAGNTSITVMAVMITGVSGAIIGRTILSLFKISDPIARGCALGMGAHVMGTSQALEEGRITGSFSAISIPVTGILTILNLPLFAYIIDKLY